MSNTVLASVRCTFLSSAWCSALAISFHIWTGRHVPTGEMGEGTGLVTKPSGWYQSHSSQAQAERAIFRMVSPLSRCCADNCVQWLCSVYNCYTEWDNLYLKKKLNLNIWLLVKTDCLIPKLVAKHASNQSSVSLNFLLHLNCFLLPAMLGMGKLLPNLKLGLASHISHATS